MELLLVRFTKPQRAFIRKAARRNKVSEAQSVRNAVELVMLAKLNSDANKTKGVV